MEAIPNGGCTSDSKKEAAPLRGSSKALKFSICPALAGHHARSG
jgi:hypothetical protein